MTRLSDIVRDAGRLAGLPPGVAPVLVVLVPVLHRPHRVKPFLESLTRATAVSARVLFLADKFDADEIDEIMSAPGTPDLAQPGGNYAEKINWGITATQEPLIFTGADDLEFHPGWLEAAVEKLGDGIGVVGTNDLCNPKVMAGEHATHFLVTREYTKRGTIDEPNSGKLMHEGYQHEWVDNELIETAKLRNAFAMALDSKVEHLHPMAGKAPMDELYDGMSRRMAEDAPYYQKRKELWCNAV